MQKTISLDSDLIGSISAHLRDLSGFATLAAELTQNADDAGDATEIRFDVRTDALVVTNDGTFSACSDPVASTCSDSVRCDLHSFRRFAGQSKRLKEDTTGAFGIGFTVAYQVTDEPELISSGQHWTLRPQLENASDRIAVCEGCEVCSGHSGTTFRLPWASQDTPTRKALGVGPVKASDQERFIEEVSSVLGDLAVFLKRVNRIVLTRQGEDVRVATAERNGSITVRSGRTVTEFISLRSDFEAEAADLKKRYRSIEAKRSATVTVAVPKRGVLKGRPYATLPTNQITELNFHLNADFFPESDRKGVHLEDGYQAKWNRAALRACGMAVAGGLPLLRDELSPKQLWRVIASTQLAPSKTSELGFSEALGPIAELTAEAVKRSEVVPLTSGGWARPHDAWIVKDHDQDLISLLEELDVCVATPAVLDALTGVEPRSLGLEFLGLPALCQMLVQCGLDESVSVEAIPQPLQPKGRLRALWVEIERMLKRGLGELDDLSGVAVFPDSLGALHPPEGVVTADRDTIELFSPWTSFLSVQRLKGCIQLREAVDEYSVRRIVSALAGQRLKSRSKILGWLAARAGDIGEASVEGEVADLPIFRGDDGAFHPLSKVRLPAGNFEDPAGVARLIAPTIVARHRDFLIELGAEELTLETYLDSVLPGALPEVGEEAVPAWIDPLLSMLTTQLAGSDSDAAHALLDELPFIPTSQGMQPPCRAYLPSRSVVSVLGAAAPIVAPVVVENHGLLLRRLRIRSEPHPGQVMARVEDLVSGPPTPDAVNPILEVLRFLTGKFSELSHSSTARQREAFMKDYARLRELEWLPAVDRSEWYRPSSVIRVSQKHLVGSRMAILSEPREPGKTSRLYKLLGIPGQPPVKVVVANLRDLSDGFEQPNIGIYEFLDRHHDDDRVSKLATEPCFLIKGRWLRPDQVYRGGNSLAPLRATLPLEVQRFPRLLAALNVYDEPHPADGLAVLREIAEQHGKAYQDHTDELEPALWEAWRLVEFGLDTGTLTSDTVRSKLEAKPVVPHRDDRLVRPRHAFVADLPEIVAAFPPEVQNAVIEPVRGTASALRAAGVRGLYSASETEVRGNASGSIDAHLATRLHELREPLLRVAEHAWGGAAATAAGEALDALKVKEQAGLESRLRLKYGEFSVGETEWEGTDVAFVRRSRTLLRSADVDRPDVFHLARQLALALAEEAGAAVEIVPLAAHVMECESVADAQAKLDGLAIPRFAARPRAAVDHAPPSTATGTQEEPADSDAEPDPEGAQAPAATRSEPNSEPDQSRPAFTEGGTARNTEIDDVGTTSSSEAAPGPSGVDLGVPAATTSKPPGREPTNISDDGRPSKRITGSRPKRRPMSPSEQWAMIVSYSASEDSGEGEDLDEEGIKARTAIERVGTRESMKFEKERGRVPTEMPVNNPGYDIESRDGKGEIVRYIEVKAISGTWGRDGFPKITPTQIEKARTVRDRFWLYVVENAGSGRPSRPIRIQDPYGSATRFVFDDGWRGRAESLSE